MKKPTKARSKLGMALACIALVAGLLLLGRYVPAFTSLSVTDLLIIIPLFVFVALAGGAFVSIWRKLRDN